LEKTIEEDRNSQAVPSPLENEEPSEKIGAKFTTEDQLAAVEKRDAACQWEEGAFESPDESKGLKKRASKR
jgi:hypothetical protein